jgi:cytoskeletal protein CcmA (bactofilin family)
MRLALFIISLCVSSCILFSTASAITTRTGDDLVVSDDEVILEDLFIAGDTVVIDGDIQGDLYAAARTVHIRGSIRDSATILASTVTVSGSIGQGVHAAVGEFNLNGMVRGNIVAAAGKVLLGEKGLVKGDVIATAQEIMVRSPVEGYVLGAGNDISINSSIRDDAFFAVRTLTLQENAWIEGNLLYISEKEAVIFPGAEVAGLVIRRIPEFQERLRGIFPFVLIAGVLGKVFSFIMMAVVGLAFMLIAPKWLYKLSERVKQYPGPCAGWGALVFFVSPIAIAMAFMTFVGITFAILAFMVYVIALYLSQIITALLLGRLLLGVKQETVKRGQLYGSFVLGLFLVRLVRFIPGIGIFVWAVAVLFGLGAFVVTLMQVKSLSTS